MNIQTIWKMVRTTMREFNDDGGARLAAALAYYALFSLTPLVVLGALLAERFLGGGAAGAAINNLRGVIGEGGAAALNGLLALQADPAVKRDFGVLAAVLSAAAVIFGSIRLFSHMKATLNYIWHVAPSPDGKRSVRGIVWRQFLVFAVVLGLGALLMASLVLNAGLVALQSVAGQLFPPGLPIWRILNLLVSFGLITLLVAVIYHTLPDVQIAWRDVWAGAMFTAGLFVPGQFLISLYVTRAGVGSAYGAAGSIIILLVWIYFAAQIFLLGAEFTCVYAGSKGREIMPDEHAVQMIRQTMVEHRQAMTKIEQDFQVRLQEIRAEADAIRARAASPTPALPRPRWSRIAVFAAPAISLITGVLLGMIGTRGEVINKLRRRLP